MSAKRILGLFIMLASLLACTRVCYAAGDRILLLGYVWEDYADLYISGNINVSTAAVNVSNQSAEVVDGGLLADKDVTVRTTVLLDISASMPKSMRGNIIDYINNYIDTLNENEQLKIVVFGEEITVLKEFTSDRYDLAKAVSAINFEGQQSMIYDAVYNTIPEIGPDNDTPCFYRTIVITDGVDESVSGITKEELFLKLQESFYPVEVMAISDSEYDVDEKDLMALTRISGGRYITMHLNDNAADLDLNADDITWIRVKLPGTVLDGATRQFNIDDGTNALEFDFKVPVFASENAEQPGEQLEEFADVHEDKEDVFNEEAFNEEADVGLSSNGTSGNEDSGTSILYYVMAMAAVLVAAIAVIIVLVHRKRKNSVSETGHQNMQEDGDATEILTGRTSIQLRKSDDPDKVWNFVLSDLIKVGRRENCQVFLDEGSVSRLQCVIYADDAGAPVIENRSNSNPTQVNKIKITTPQRLSDGDRIKCGRVILIVGLAVNESSEADKNINKMTEFINL